MIVLFISAEQKKIQALFQKQKYQRDHFHHDQLRLHPLCMIQNINTKNLEKYYQKLFKIQY